jgi:hypothetical protein
MAINDGGPAFPFNQYGVRYGGMTLRDWFAGQALAGQALAAYHEARPDMRIITTEAIADRAYSIADAMLRAREVKP